MAIGLRNLSFLLLPGRCVLCELPTLRSADLCLTCEQAMADRQSRCQCCALPLPAPGWCGECQRDTPPFTRTITGCDYRDPARTLVLRLKHQRDLAAGRALAQLLYHHITPNYVGDNLPDGLVAVPQHWRRTLARGFNQARELANHLGTELGIPVIDNSRRLRHHPSQQGQNRQARLRNIKGSFDVRKTLDRRHVAIVDDVMTTGATVRALALSLREAGADRVDVWCVARTALEK